MDNLNLDINVDIKDNQTAVIQLSKQMLGGSDALQFATTLRNLAEKDVVKVIVDMSQVELINSSGLGMLVSGLSTLRKNNISLNLANVPFKVLNLLEMTHLNQVFKLYDSVEEALKPE